MSESSSRLTALQNKEPKMRLLPVLLYGVVIGVLTILLLTFGTTYNWPDFVHTNHGLPLVWGTHTLSTIVGPADSWSVNLGFLAIDLSIWLGVLVAGLVIMGRYLRR